MGGITMQHMAEVFQGVAALLWPLLALFVVIRFAPAVAGIIDSAKRRGFTLRVGGQELSMQEVSDQQTSLIADLQKQVAALMATIGVEPDRAAVSGEDETLAEDQLPPPAGLGPSRVLWVDDEPKNNSVLVESLNNAGVQVDIASSTGEAMGKLRHRDYRLVVTDIGRHEGTRYNESAGIELVEAVRTARPAMPVAVYTTVNGVRYRGEEARQLGASLVTSSATELIRFFATQLPGIAYTSL